MLWRFYLKSCICYGCAGSPLLCEDFLYAWKGLLFVVLQGLLIAVVSVAMELRLLGCLGSLASRSWVPQHRLSRLWYTDLVAPKHEGSSQTRNLTGVSCIGR